ncbi:MAG: hypothetical protein ACRDZM_09480 [Acidimicrobiia bacterium]
MGVTGVIDRDKTVKDRTVEQGMEVEIIASAAQCGSENLFYGIGVLDPGAHTGLHVHDGIEIAWFMLAGETYCVMGSLEDGDYGIEECHRNSAGYVASGEIHLQVNRSDTEPAVILMAYVGTNTAPGAQGRLVEMPEVLQGLLEAKGITLSDHVITARKTSRTEK